MNSFVEFFCCISSYFWIFYLIIPGWLGWYLIKWCWGKMTKIEYAETKDGEKDGKKKEKKKEKVVYKKVR